MAHVFNRYNVPSKEAIIETGKNALVFLYGGDQGEKLDTLRYKMVCKVSKSTSHVEPQSLPPTSTAAKHHITKSWSGKMQQLI